jgi:outer membrane protein TolC
MGLRAHAQEVPTARAVAESAQPAIDATEDDGAMLLDEAKVVTLALADHPHIEAAEADRDAAAEARRAGRRALIPDVQLSGRYTRLSSIPTQYRSLNGFTFPQLLDSFGARAQLVVPLSELFLNLAASARALGHLAEAAELELVSARAPIAYEARAAFLNYWRSKLALATAVETTRAASSQVRDQRARQEAGTVARNDVLTFEVALDQAVLGEQRAQADPRSAGAAR